MPVARFEIGTIVSYQGRLYVVLGVTDFVLMRRYAQPDRPMPREELPAPAVTY